MVVPTAALLLALAAPLPPTKADPPPPAGPEVEVRCVDDSALKVRLLDEKLELVTRYGVLQIPAADVRRVEFATRLPAGATERIEAAVAVLGSPEFKARERAAADLRGFRGWAYPAVLRAAGHGDPEVARRAEAVAEHLRATVSPELLTHRAEDVVHTADARLPGRLSAASLRVHTLAFGEQRLRLSDVYALGPAGGSAAAAANAPANLMAYAGQFGKELTFRVVGGEVTVPQPAMAGMPGGGRVMMMGGGPAAVWGTDVYTLDSSVAQAAVHAGQAALGQAATVRVRIVQSPPQFVGSARNGVQSQPFNFFPQGAYQFLPR
jgi:hypothetical protein